MHDAVLAAALAGGGKGHIETIVAIAAAVVVGALLVISIVLGVTRRGSPLAWLGSGVVAFFATLVVLSFV